MTLSEKLIKCRKEMVLSQKEMADLLNITEFSYKFLEYGEPLWSTEKLERRVDEIVEEYRKNNSTN